MVDQRDVALRRRRVTVLGAGKSGLAALRALCERGARPFLSEGGTLSESARSALRAWGVPFEQGGHTDRALEAGLVVVSPGVPWKHPTLQAAREAGVAVWGELELGYRLCPSARIVAVTGTNGKSTTTRLVGALLAGAGEAAAVGGNLGTPLCALLPEITPETWVVLEVSSFQLETVQALRPHVGVWLNLSPDHLDRHGSLAVYRALKGRLFRGQTPDDHAVLGADLTLPFGCRARRHAFAPLQGEHFEGLPRHQRANLGAALAAARLANPRASLETIDWARCLRQPHCLEFVGEVGGVRFVNDSKATNPRAALEALEALKAHAPLSVLLGGCPKGAAPDALAAYIARSPHVAQAIAVGPHAGHWREALARAGCARAQSADDLEAALRALAPEARTCVLAPGGASFDQFANYAERGEAFRAAVAALQRAQVA